MILDARAGFKDDDLDALLRKLVARAFRRPAPEPTITTTPLSFRSNFAI
jgi:hypothetical protein